MPNSHVSNPLGNRMQVLKFKPAPARGGPFKKRFTLTGHLTRKPVIKSQISAV